jgi:hypothetical protein
MSEQDTNNLSPDTTTDDVVANIDNTKTVETTDVVNEADVAVPTEVTKDMGEADELKEDVSESDTKEVLNSDATEEQKDTADTTEATCEANTDTNTDSAQTDSPTTPEQVYSVSLDDVDYNSTFRVNKGALAQLVYSLVDMKNRLDSPDENNKVQMKLYPVIESICDRLHTKYVDLLKDVKPDLHREFSYFLMGPYGNGTLRYPTSINTEKKMYKYSELGPTFRAMSNRLVHASREVRSRLVSEKYSERKESYEALLNFLTEFDKELKSCSETWKDTVYKVRSEEGIDKEKKPRFKKKFNRSENTNRSEPRPRFVKFRRRAFNEQSGSDNASHSS